MFAVLGSDQTCKILGLCEFGSTFMSKKENRKVLYTSIMQGLFNAHANNYRSCWEGIWWGQGQWVLSKWAPVFWPGFLVHLSVLGRLFFCHAVLTTPPEALTLLRAQLKTSPVKSECMFWASPSLSTGSDSGIRRHFWEEDRRNLQLIKIKDHFLSLLSLSRIFFCFVCLSFPVGVLFPMSLWMQLAGSHHLWKWF